MAKNNIVDISFGQQGSTYINTTAAGVPPAGRVYSAIYMITATVFKSANGLVAEENISGPITVNPVTNNGPLTYINTEGIGAGTGGQVLDGVSFPAGSTIYGRFKKVDLVSGRVIAYVSN